jgi:biotin carboxylase
MHSKTVVAIVDPYSSGTQLIREVEARGHTCLLVKSQADVPGIYRSSFQADDYDSIIQYRGNLEETIAELEGRHVGCVIAGCEIGVELSDRLSEKMGLLSNGTRLSPARRNKSLMAETLRQHGVRIPATLSSGDLDQIMDWVREHGRWPVVVKPLCSSASDGVVRCLNEAEVRDAFADITGRSDVYGAANENVVVQEFLTGTEYAVDTVSYASRHRVTEIWEYGKPVASGPFFGNDSLELLAYSPSLHGQLAPYVTRVLDALEIKYGPAHCELMLTQSGPVIVEIGARLNGGNNPLLSRYCGVECQFDVLLDAYLDPQRFLDRVDEPYASSKTGMRVFLTPPQNGRLKSPPNLDPIERLESFYKLKCSARPGRPVSRIVGWVLLVHEDRAVIHRDRDRIRCLEASGFYQFESGE